MADADSIAPLKRCTKCGADKPATSEFFHAYKRSPDGRRSVCRECRSADHAEHKAERNEKRKAFYAHNRERLNAEVRDYYARNAEAMRAAALERHHRNRDKRLPQMRAYQQANRETLLAKKREREARRFRDLYGKDLAFTLRHRLRSLLRVTLTNGREGKRLHEVLGYTTAELKAHLERQFTKGMSWEAFQRGEIEIDHIRPLASFSITCASDPDFTACWGLANLRPMWASENRSKGAKVLMLV